MKKTLRSRIATVAVAALGFGLVQAVPAFAVTTNFDATGGFDFYDASSTELCVKPTAVTADGASKTGKIDRTGTFDLKAALTGGNHNDSQTVFTVTGGTITAENVDGVSVVSGTSLTVPAGDADAGNVVTFTPSAAGPAASSTMVITVKTGTTTVTTWTLTVGSCWTNTGEYKFGALADGQIGTCKIGDDAADDASSTTGTLRSDGAIVLKPNAAAVTDGRFTVTGGTIAAYVKGSSQTTDVLNSGRTSLTFDTNGSQNAPTLTFKPSGVGTMQIVLEGGAISGTTFTSYGVSALWTFTVAATCENAAYSATKSTVNLATDATTTAALDVTGANRRNNGATGYVNIALKDAYEDNLSAGQLTVSVTTGAVVTFGTNTPAASDYVAVTGASVYSARVTQAQANVPVTTTITVAYNGTTIATKTLTIRGALAKLEASGDYVGARGSSLGVNTNSNDTNGAAELGSLVAYDSAGNSLDTDAYAASYTFGGLGAQIPAVAIDSFNGTYRYAPLSWTCGTVGTGESKITISAVSETGLKVTSNEFTAACAGGVYTYKATLDKKEYSPGDTAILTITAFDSKGKPVYDYTAQSAISASTGRATNPFGRPMLGGYYVTNVGTDGYMGTVDDTGYVIDDQLPVVAGGPVDFVVAPKATDAFLGGKKTYTLVIRTGAVGGNYNLVVNLPRYNDETVPQSAVVIPYTVKAGAADPTVLALTTAVQTMMTSIQLLMTSLSSSIAALIKALTPKKK